MKITIENFAGCRRAEIAIKPGALTVIGGRNASGKTSVMTAMGAVLAREPNPYGAQLAARSRYAHNGLDPFVMLEAPSGEVKWAIREGEFRQVGSPPVCMGATVADELGDLFSAQQKARAAVWERVFPPPTFHDLVDQLLAVFPDEPDNATRELCQEMAGLIVKEGDGWDYAHQTLRERLRAEKAVWEQTLADGKVRAKYGAKRAIQTRPEGWHDELEDLSIDAAECLLSAAIDKLEIATNEEALTEAGAQALAELREEHATTKERVEKLTADKARAELAKQRAEDEAQVAWDALIETGKQLSDAEKGFVDLNAPRRDVEDLTKRVEFMREEYQTLTAASIELKEKIVALDLELEMNREKLAKLKKSNEGVGPVPPVIPCPECKTDLIIEADVPLRAATDKEAAAFRKWDPQKMYAVEADIKNTVKKLNKQEADREALADELKSKQIAKAQSEEQGKDLANDLKEASARLEKLENQANGQGNDSHIAALRENVAKAKLAKQAAASAKAQPVQDYETVAEALSRAEGSAETLSERIAKLEARPVQSEAEAEAVATAREAVDTAKKELRAVEIQARAWRSHKSVQRLATLEDAVSPAGIRASLAGQSVDAVAEAVTSILSAVGIGSLRIDAKTFVITLDGRPAAFASASERLVMTIALKLAIAIETASPVVTCDAADLLDAERWPAFRKRMDVVAAKSGVAIVVAATDAPGADFEMVNGEAKEKI